MPAAIPFIPLIAAAATVTAGAVISNQSVQHQKGAVQAQQTQANAAALAQGPAPNSKVPTLSDSALTAQADLRRKNALRAGIMSTIGTGAASPDPSKAPVAYGSGSKTTLG